MSKTERGKAKWKNDFARSLLNKARRQEKHKKLHPKDVQTVEQAKRANLSGIQKRSKEALQSVLNRRNNEDRGFRNSQQKRVKRVRDEE